MARLKRKRMLLVGGVVGGLVVAGGLAAALLVTGPDADDSITKAVPVRIATAASTPPAQATSEAANTGATAPKTPGGEDIVGRMRALEKEGNWNLVVLYGVEWTRKQPANPDAWKSLSQGYAKLRQYADAQTAAIKATQLAPEDFTQWKNLGEINVVLQVPGEALVAFRHATALNDRDFASLVQEGLLNAELGHLADARTAFAKALAMNPDNVPALCGAASVAQKEGRAKDAEALTRQVKALDDRCRDANDGDSVRVTAGARSRDDIKPKR